MSDNSKKYFKIPGYRGPHRTLIFVFKALESGKIERRSFKVPRTGDLKSQLAVGLEMAKAEIYLLPRANWTITKTWAVLDGGVK